MSKMLLSPQSHRSAVDGQIFAYRNDVGEDFVIALSNNSKPTWMACRTCNLYRNNDTDRTGFLSPSWTQVGTSGITFYIPCCQEYRKKYPHRYKKPLPHHVVPRKKPPLRPQPQPPPPPKKKKKIPPTRVTFDSRPPAPHSLPMSYKHSRPLALEAPGRPKRTQKQPLYLAQFTVPGS
ncbi:hypothetical protein pipiens_018047 [Culex pipiens pipiens]|uniref:Uncharacterized protein n=1 Tax=Culex pipiens pipiens TaxID=38569 RepID=A0ABD1CES6_CULPP